MAIVSQLGPSYQIVADPKFIKQTWISLAKGCEKFRERVYNCSHFMQQMLPQVDGLTYPIQHRSTQSMNFVIQCISKFFTGAKLHDSCQILVTDHLGQNIFKQMKKSEFYANICQFLELLLAPINNVVAEPSRLVCCQHFQHC